MQSRQHILERLKGLEISQYEALAKEWEAWWKELSLEELNRYWSDVCDCALFLGLSMEELAHVGTPLAFENVHLIEMAMLAVWQARRLAELRDTYAQKTTPIQA